MDGYAVEAPLDELLAKGAVVALERDGKALGIGGFGPKQIVSAGAGGYEGHAGRLVDLAGLPPQRGVERPRRRWHHRAARIRQGGRAMLRPGSAVLALALAGCAPAGTPEAANHGAEVEACAAAVAAHVGKGRDAVTARWAGTTAGGLGVVTVSDAQGAAGERVHDCEVDGAGRVLAIRHQGA
jgi:hypothetical protein